MVATGALKVNAGYCASGPVEAALRMDHRFLGKCRAAVDDFIQRAIAEHREP